MCAAGRLTNQRLSALFMDAATAKWNSIKIIGEGTTAADRKELLTAVGFGALLAERRGTRANSYAIVGEVLAAWGERADARSAFAAAYEYGLRAGWLESQWSAVTESGQVSIESYPEMELEHMQEALEELKVSSDIRD